MTPTHPSPRVTTERVTRYIDAHRLTDSGGSLACRIALDLLDARQQLADVVETAMEEHAELMAARERIVKLDAALDAALLAIDQYHATLFGEWRARGQV